MISYVPMEIEQDITCQHCGRTVVAPPAPSDSIEIDQSEVFEANSDSNTTTRTSELFRNLTVVIAICAIAEGLAPILTSFLISAVIIAAIVNGFHNKVLPKAFAKRFQQLDERLKLFPYELITPAFWFILLLCKIAGASPAAISYTAIASVVISYQLSVKANEVANSSIISFNKLSFKSFLSLWGFFKVESNTTGAESLDPEATYMEDAAVERSRVEASKNEHDQEKVVRHQKLALERTLWEEEVASRYESWIEEESDRLKSRLDVKQFKEMN